MPNLIPRAEFLLQSLFAQQKSCPHCHSKDIYVVTRKYPTVSVKKCRQCLLCFTSPIYKSWFSKNFYESFYSGEGLTTQMPTAKELAHLRETNFLGTDKDFNWLLPRIASVAGANGRRLLDIGCSWGYFLFQAKKYGFDGIGIEIDPKRGAFGREHLGVAIVQSFDELLEAKFDIAFSCHAFEHFTSLSSVIDKIRDRLVPGGHLFIIVPIFDWDRFGKKNLHHIGAVHPLGFSLEFFKRNLPRYGFSIRYFFSRAIDFPDQPSDTSAEDGLMVWAVRD